MSVGCLFSTDVEHEIKEVTSGHRITLIYHLYRYSTCSSTVLVVTEDCESEMVERL